MSILEPEILTAAAGVVASLVASLIAFVQRESAKSRRDAHEKELSEIIEWLSEPLHVGVKVDSGTTDEAIRGLEAELIERLSASGLSRAAIKSQIEAELTSFRDRIAKIERRFPPESELQKIASINDAIFSERIDQLSKRVDALEERSLTKWDVALTVSMIIGGIFAVVGATVGVIQYFS